MIKKSWGGTRVFFGNLYRKSPAIALVLVAMFLAATQAYARDTLHMAIAATSPGSAAYFMVGAIAEYLRSRAPVGGLSVVPQPGTFLGNIRTTGRGETEMGITGSSMLYEAVRGIGAFANEKPYTNLRALFPTHVAASQWVTYRSDLATVSDLAGKRVNFGPPGTAAQNYADMVLAAAGIAGTIAAEYQGWSDAVRMMQDGQLDAFHVIGPYPFPSVQEAAAVPNRQLRFIPIGEDNLRRALEAHPYAYPVRIPADAYGPGVPDHEYVSVGYVAFIVAHKDVPEWAVYELMKAVLGEEGRRFLLNAYAGYQSGFDAFPGFGALEAAGVPLHPGAVRYWREQGYDVPASLVEEEPTGEERA